MILKKDMLSRHKDDVLLKRFRAKALMELAPYIDYVFAIPCRKEEIMVRLKDRIHANRIDYWIITSVYPNYDHTNVAFKPKEEV